MEVVELRLNGLKLIRPSVFGDERGFFFESYRRDRYFGAGITVDFVQDNASFSRKEIIRGLHFQGKPGQAKLVSVSAGRIWDVAVDIRPNSPTFGEWEAIELDDETHAQLFIPVGFAHGFCVLSEMALVHYKISSPYDSVEEKAIRWDDPDLGIAWPTDRPVLSPRDQTAPLLKELKIQ